MKFFLGRYKAAWVVAMLVLLVTVATRCVSSSQTKTDLRGGNYAGADRCQPCHGDALNSYLHTAHAKTTQAPSSASISGSFAESHNRFVFSDAWSVVMEQRGGQFFQTGYHSGIKTVSYPFDVVVGSGRKAQTYLTYRDSGVYQLPISYFVPAQDWANSPNFPADVPKFDRSVPLGCFGCHSSAVGVTESYRGMQKSEAFEKGAIIYGVDCERCHGPAAQHVAYQEAHPAEKTAKFITSIKSLNRQQQTDLCGICHSGTKNMQRPAFAFQPGQVREEYFFPDYGSPLADQLDVHGNQYALMKGSRCNLESQRLTCNSCHSPHQNERENLAVFSQRCTTCHQQPEHSFVKSGTLTSATVAANCIDCHMPQKASRVITLLTQGQTAATPDSIRTHLIKIYTDETLRFLAQAKR